jgi:hypothetical protein
MVDNEKIIPLVSERRPLWYTGDKTCHNREISRKLWNEIAADMRCTSKFNNQV